MKIANAHRGNKALYMIYALDTKGLEPSAEIMLQSTISVEPSPLGQSFMGHQGRHGGINTLNHTTINHLVQIAIFSPCAIS